MDLGILIAPAKNVIYLLALLLACACQEACGQAESGESAVAVPMEPITLDSASATATRGLNNDLRMWLPVFVLMPVRSKKLKLYIEAVPRLGQDITNLNQFLLRNQIWWQPTQRLNFQAGYVWSTVFQPQRIQDNRISAETNYAFPVRQLKVFNRLRMEERFIEHLHDASVRLRHRLYLLHPLYKQYFQMVASNELFVNLNSVQNGPRAGIDENRFFAGFRIRPAKYSACEIGYMQQYLNRDVIQDQLNHIIYIGIAQDI